jgi:hypothetical protein
LTDTTGRSLPESTTIGGHVELARWLQLLIDTSADRNGRPVRGLRDEQKGCGD